MYFDGPFIATKDFFSFCDPLRGGSLGDLQEAQCPNVFQKMETWRDEERKKSEIQNLEIEFRFNYGPQIEQVGSRPAGSATNEASKHN